MSKESIHKHLRSAAAQFQRLAISNFWEARATFLERQAVALFREAGVARENAKTALHLTDEGAESVFHALTAKTGTAAEVKTVVQPDDGKGKAN